MNIEYKNIPDFDGYRVGSDGSIWSSRDFRGGYGENWREIKPKKAKSGHLNVCLRQNGKTLTRWVHRLVLESFIGRCPERMECRHKNGIPSDNRLVNLVWDSLTENRKDRNRHSDWNHGSNHPLAKLDYSDIQLIRTRCQEGETQLSVSKAFGISQGHVSDIVNRKYRQRS